MSHKNESHIGPPHFVEYLLSLEWFTNFRACSLISYRDMMPFPSPFLDLHLTTHHSNIGVQFKQVTELSLLKLVQDSSNDLLCDKLRAHPYFLCVGVYGKTTSLIFLLSFPLYNVIYPK